MSARIFISYRRGDSSAWAGRLHDRLVQVFPASDVFMDTAGIEPGANFKSVLNERLAACQIALVVIGRQWLTFAKNGGRALDDPEDFVRMEIEAMLRRNIRVIPVLVDGAGMPTAAELPDGLQDLAWRQAVPITHASFVADARTLIETVTRAALAEGPSQLARATDPGATLVGPTVSQPRGPRWIGYAIVAAGALGAAISVLAIRPGEILRRFAAATNWLDYNTDDLLLTYNWPHWTMSSRNWWGLAGALVLLAATAVWVALNRRYARTHHYAVTAAAAVVAGALIYMSLTWWLPDLSSPFGIFLSRQGTGLPFDPDRAVA